MTCVALIVSDSTVGIELAIAALIVSVVSVLVNWIRDRDKAKRDEVNDTRAQVERLERLHDALERKEAECQEDRRRLQEDLIAALQSRRQQGEPESRRKGGA